MNKKQRRQRGGRGSGKSCAPNRGCCRSRSARSRARRDAEEIARERERLDQERERERWERASTAAREGREASFSFVHSPYLVDGFYAVYQPAGASGRDWNRQDNADAATLATSSSPLFQPTDNGDWFERLCSWRKRWKTPPLLLLVSYVRELFALVASPLPLALILALLFIGGVELNPGPPVEDERAPTERRLSCPICQRPMPRSTVAALGHCAECNRGLEAWQLNPTRGDAAPGEAAAPAVLPAPLQLGEGADGGPSEGGGGGGLSSGSGDFQHGDVAMAEPHAHAGQPADGETAGEGDGDHAPTPLPSSRSDVMSDDGDGDAIDAEPAEDVEDVAEVGEEDERVHSDEEEEEDGMQQLPWSRGGHAPFSESCLAVRLAARLTHPASRPAMSSLAAPLKKTLTVHFKAFGTKDVKAQAMSVKADTPIASFETAVRGVMGAPDCVTFNYAAGFEEGALVLMVDDVIADADVTEIYILYSVRGALTGSKLTGLKYATPQIRKKRVFLGHAGLDR